MAGGGTAGHIEPALAVAREWREIHPDASVTFLGTAHGLETTLIPEAGFNLTLIPKVAIARKLSPSLLKVPFQLIASIRAASKALTGVDVAIGFGGYVSAPLYCAAVLRRVPYVIHEQNAKPGWSNKIGARFTKFIALSYPVTAGVMAQGEITGLPLRRDVLEALSASVRNWEIARHEAQARLRKKYALDNGPIIFIFGGSQGSQYINSIIEQCQTSLESIGAAVIHAVGKNNPLPARSSRYCPTHYIDDMADHYLGADLIIGRSGAVTCAEVAALGRYALFIPLPVGNGEQSLNAAELVSSKRATVISQSQFTASWLESHLDELLKESAERSAEGDASGATSVDKIVAMIEKARTSR